MSTLLFWAILILCVGLMLLVAELFVPSGGVLGVLAALAVIGSVVLAFRSSADHGLVFLLIVAVAIPAVLAFGLQMWPKTPLGRRMLLSAPSPKDIDPRDSRDLELVSLIGQVGRTITPLRPSGMTEIAGRRVERTRRSG
jgi:membrane-bound ClpP family serine protease